MGMVTVSCPHCRFSRQVERGVIPEGTERATCPRCRESFPLEGNLREEPAVSWGKTEPPRERPAPPRTLRFSFTGTAGEYFGIWIVNTLLKICTLGVYSAWAKVRKRRWYCGNTLLDGSPFDYLADPKALFRGWLVGVLAFILYSVGTRYSPTLASILGLAFFLAVPWLVVRSRLFNLRNSTYRNIRFGFETDYREAYVVYAGLYFLVPFTLGLIFPYMLYRQKRFLVERSAYGRTPFTFEAQAKDFYLLFLRAAGWLVLVVAVVLPLTFYVVSSVAEGGALLADADLGRTRVMVGGVMALSLPLIYFFIIVYVQTALANLTWNSTRIGGSRFESALRVRDMAWLYFSSAVAIFLSLGLMIPWASVRLARYRFETLSVVAAGDLEGFRAAGRAEVGAAGEEIGDLFGIDVAL